MAKYCYTVEGRMSFPLDMLRYDRCWPADGDSAAEIYASFDRTERGTFKVNLVSDNKPTSGRWQSFLWSVKEVM
jgi:hypothetical protein